MIAGRGLGHTGGTLDKLEAISGMNVFPQIQTAQTIIKNLGGVFLGQTPELAPLDKKLYALRDVTGTVESIPLITASIQSKKLAEGIDSLVMDVKYGSGAFMKALGDATALAQSLLVVGKACGLNMSCLVTSTNSPLGRYSGNALEVVECVNIMQGQWQPGDTLVELCIELAHDMLILSGVSATGLKQQLMTKLRDGSVFEQFCKIIAAQGGDTAQLNDVTKLPQAPTCGDLVAAQSGYISAIDVRKLGLGIIELGGGRRRADDRVNPAVGYSATRHVGEKVLKGEPLLKIHAATVQDLQRVQKQLASDTFVISPNAPPLML